MMTAVSAAVGERNEELPLLYDAVDSDALDALFEHVSRDTSDRAGHVTFSCAGLIVTVSANGEVSVKVID